MLVKIQLCPACQSNQIVKNGHTRHGNQRVKCYSCGKTKVLTPKKKPLDLPALQRALRERLSLRGVARVFKVSLQTVLLIVQWTVQQLPPVRKSVQLAHKEDIIEFDEIWSYVHDKQQERWLWTAISRRTRQIIAWAVGDHSRETFKQLLRKMPDEYRRCVSYSDAWRAYDLLLKSSARHQKVGKESGQTNHMERWNNTLRQRLSRYVRKALSFSKTDMFHQLTTKLFIWHYNMERINTF
jgi:insertion element IS1 protein InsB